MSSIGEFSDCETGSDTMKGEKDRKLGRKSLRLQCSSEKDLARLKGGPIQVLPIREVPRWVGMA